MKQDMMVLCDHVRDTILPDLGVKVEDQANGDFLWKLMNQKEKELFIKEVLNIILVEKGPLFLFIICS